MGIEHHVEEAGSAGKRVEVFEAFEMRSHLKEELVGGWVGLREVLHSGDYL
jgi:hypothetical protein